MYELHTVPEPGTLLGLLTLGGIGLASKRKKQK
ncbi:MAG: PEP-CTERM sorting domain-containing protein [Crocosphaera sp.]|nr:PEP-CTERM sorting domain-containing protein [Crocosphaera sp.]